MTLSPDDKNKILNLLAHDHDDEDHQQALTLLEAIASQQNDWEGIFGLLSINKGKIQSTSSQMFSDRVLLGALCTYVNKGFLPAQEVTKLSLSEIPTFPDNFSCLIYLSQITLDHPKLSGLEALTSLTALKDLRIVFFKAPKNHKNFSLEGISSIRNLERLRISSCDIGQVPKELEQLTKLQKIEFLNTDLTRMCNMYHLSELTHLNLFSNQLTSIPVTQLSRLKYLNISKNNIQKTSLDLRGASLLTSLHVAGHQHLKKLSGKRFVLCSIGFNLTPIHISWLLQPNQRNWAKRCVPLFSFAVVASSKLRVMCGVCNLRRHVEEMGRERRLVLSNYLLV